MKHPRAELIAKWLEDTTQVIWYWDELENIWSKGKIDYLTDVNDEAAYSVGEKPTKPPQKMCTLAGVSFPVPLSITSGCEVGITVWRNTSEDSATHYVYGFDDTKDAAACTKAIAEVIKQAIKEAK